MTASKFKMGDLVQVIASRPKYDSGKTIGWSSRMDKYFGIEALIRYVEYDDRRHYSYYKIQAVDKSIVIAPWIWLDEWLELISMPDAWTEELMLNYD